MDLIQCYLIANDCYKTSRTITPKGVMVHSTGANNPAVARYVQPVEGQSNEAQLKEQIGTNRNANDWNNHGLDVCTHAFVGKFADDSVGTAQTLPWNHRGWHAGTGTSGGSANNTHIAFEICEDGLADAAYFGKVYQEAVELTAMLCKQYNLNPLAGGVVGVDVVDLLNRIRCLRRLSSEKKAKPPNTRADGRGAFRITRAGNAGSKEGNGVIVQRRDGWVNAFDENVYLEVRQTVVAVKV